MRLLQQFVVMSVPPGLKSVPAQRMYKERTMLCDLQLSMSTLFSAYNRLLERSIVCRPGSSWPGGRKA